MTAPSVIVFAVVYAIAYLICVEGNYALFTYHPAINEFGMGVQKAKDGPAMYWYGWLATSGIVAGIAGALATLLPQGAARHLWPASTWVVALAAMAAFCWLLKGFFLR
ncbi:MAG: hypothetical protein QOD26_1506 [Betaproteobacteria bacterium]|jgi:hypothetical protein|nr:hypothetical protein [Betaproteobacteria bacterium]